MKRPILFFLAFVLISNLVDAQYYIQAKTPQRIIINLTDSPCKSMAVTWRTVAKINLPVVEVTEATNWTEIDSSSRKVSVISKKFVTDKRFEVYQHSAIMNELKPNTMYAYRVGGDSLGVNGIILQLPNKR